MATRRMIRKDDFEMLEFQSLTIRQKFIFWATNLFADDDGILPFRFAKPWLFPLDEDVKIDDILDDYKALEAYSFVMLYANDEYVQVCDWWYRQFIDKKIYKPTNASVLPPSYRPRPEDLKKYHYKSRVVLDQSRTDESSEAKTSPVQENIEEHRQGDGPSYPDYVFE